RSSLASGSLCWRCALEKQTLLATLRRQAQLRLLLQTQARARLSARTDCRILDDDGEVFQSSLQAGAAVAIGGFRCGAASWAECVLAPSASYLLVPLALQAPGEDLPATAAVLTSSTVRVGRPLWLGWQAVRAAWAAYARSQRQRARRVPRRAAVHGEGPRLPRRPLVGPELARPGSGGVGREPRGGAFPRGGLRRERHAPLLSRGRAYQRLAPAGLRADPAGGAAQRDQWRICRVGELAQVPDDLQRAAWELALPGRGELGRRRGHGCIARAVRAGGVNFGARRARREECGVRSAA
ncbi:unnamed protein product, partial [Prorocentrum cordatum]